MRVTNSIVGLTKVSPVKSSTQQVPQINFKEINNIFHRNVFKNSVKFYQGVVCYYFFTYTYNAYNSFKGTMKQFQKNYDFFF